MNGPQADAAIEELRRRIAQGELSASHLNAVVEDAITLRLNNASLWTQDWGGLVREAIEAGGGNQSQLDRLTAALFEPRLKPLLHRQLWPNVQWPAGVGVSGIQRFSYDRFYRVARVVEMAVDGTPLQLKDRGGDPPVSSLESGSAIWCYVEEAATSRVAVGRHEVVQIVEVELRLTKLGSPVGKARIPLRYAIDVFPPGTPVLPRFRNPALVKLIRESLDEPDEMWVERDKEWGKFIPALADRPVLMAMYPLVRPHVTVRFDAFVRYGSQEWRVGGFGFDSGGWIRDRAPEPKPAKSGPALPAEATHVDVFLRPNERSSIAVGDDGLMDEIVFRDVPVRRGNDAQGEQSASGVSIPR